MNILGVGPAEVIVILIIMLVVAGPKRMVQWAYQLGRYTAQLRAMFQETMNAVQKELAESGLDVTKDLPSIPRSFDIVSEAAKVINAEVSEATTSINATLSSTTSAATSAATSATTTSPATSAPNEAATPPAPAGSAGSGGSAVGPAGAPTQNTTPSNGTEPKTDGEKPRYDSWLPN